MFFKGPFWGAYFWRGLSTEGNLRFKIDWASLINRRKFTVFALFYFVFEGNFQVQDPRGAYIWRGNLTEGFLRNESGGLYLEGLIFGILRYAFVCSNDNRNLRKYIFVCILKIFKESNFRTLGHFTQIYLHCVGHAETFLSNYDVK